MKKRKASVGQDEVLSNDVTKKDVVGAIVGEELESGLDG
jgi:hypothetical protein